MIGALLGAIASIASGAMGASATTQAADQNYQMDLLNYYARERERNDAIQQGRRQEADTKLGSTDAQGNRVHFVPGKGWVTDLSESSKKLSDLYQSEELAQLENDLPKKRDRLNVNDQRQDREGNVASGLLDAFQRIHRENPADLENQLNQASTRGITEGYDSTLQDAMQSAIRTGASNSGKVAADIGASRSKALVDAFLNNKINARSQSEGEFANKQANASNLYNMFATRASAMPDVAYNPRNIEGQTAQQQAGAKGSTDNAMANLLNAFAKQGGSMSKIEPNMGWANAVASGGNALAAAFENMGSNKYKQGAFDDYAQYGGLDPEQYQGNRGGW